MPWKRYLVFGFDEFYPAGGLYDLLATCDTVEEARAYLGRNDFTQVVDSTTGEQVDGRILGDPS